MLDIDQDGLSPSSRWMRPLALARDLELGVYLNVEQPGTIRVGDVVAIDS